MKWIRKGDWRLQGRRCVRKSLGRGAELGRRWMSLKLHNLPHLVVWGLTCVENINNCELNRFQKYFSVNWSVNTIKFSPIFSFMNENIGVRNSLIISVLMFACGFFLFVFFFCCSTISQKVSWPDNENEEHNFEIGLFFQFYSGIHCLLIVGFWKITIKFS